MTETFAELKRKSLQEQQNIVTQRWIDAKNQLNNTLNAADKVPLKNQIKDLEAEIHDIEAELQKEDTGASDPKQRHLAIQANLPKLDCKKAITIFGDILDQFRDEGGAALFLIQNSVTLGGEMCATRLREEARTRVASGKFVHRPIGFKPGSTINELGLLEPLAGYWGITCDPQNLADSALQLVDKICGSLQDGCIVVIEITGCDYLRPLDQVLTWFLSNFWVPLLRKLPTIAKDYSRVRFLGVFVANSKITPSLSPALYCSGRRSDPEKLLELPLQRCTLEDIKKWLADFSHEQGRNRIDSIANEIFKLSRKGELTAVCELLEKHFC